MSSWLSGPHYPILPESLDHPRPELYFLESAKRRHRCPFLAIILHRMIVRRPLTFWPDESSYAESGLEIGCMALLNRGRAALGSIHEMRLGLCEDKYRSDLT